MRIAIVGSGVAGITSAVVLQARGHQVVLFERADEVGGVWSQAYPEVRLQNVATHYHLSGFDWPFQPDLHPTATQVLRYLREVVEHHALDLRLRHEVVQLEPLEQGWRVLARDSSGASPQEVEETFDWVVIAVGHFTQGKAELSVPGRERFRGTIVTERDVEDLEVLRDRHVAVVGFGKSAVDFACFAAARGSTVEHVFRTPRWLIPEYIGGVMHYEHAIFTRFGSVMIPCWTHPTGVQRAFHERLGGAVGGFWGLITAILRRQILHTGRGRGREVRRRLETLIPEHSLVSDMRAAAALAPERYYDEVAAGRILPHRGQVARIEDDGLVLDDGRRISADTLVLTLGSKGAEFPYLPPPYREMLEREPDGPQLYRHVLHPRIPRLGFIGYNQSFLTFPSMEVGTLWLSAVMDGELLLPSVDQMEGCIERVRAWKREHVNFEPSRSSGVQTRWQHYIDIMLRELGLNPYRKLPNPLAEVFQPYSASDYAGVLEEYRRASSQRREPLRPLPLDT
ncbi:flavin-containing monooxygenase [Paraliomyxa miuraensis]|uniref:flavin-containing monooxygenase n=1 Tax=Paraliomyxa miuraensis TaxID=376150 RepID=UPI00225C1122|nr:FAD-dependent oxidoreductase [Paraliomyxa miuraensis]MCX4240427.1 FAD-dependent oxidoreductase [Paraliomyxa miuraensis]